MKPQLIGNHVDPKFQDITQTFLADILTYREGVKPRSTLASFTKECTRLKLHTSAGSLENYITNPEIISTEIEICKVPSLDALNESNVEIAVTAEGVKSADSSLSLPDFKKYTEEFGKEIRRFPGCQIDTVDLKEKEIAFKCKSVTWDTMPETKDALVNKLDKSLAIIGNNINKAFNAFFP